MTAATPASPSNWLILFATLMVQSLVAMALLTLPVVTPLVAQDLGVSASYVGLYVALVYVGAMTASLISGAGVRRFGAIRLSQMGLGACAVGLLLCAVPSLPALAVGALLIGMGYGPITPASSHLLVRTTPAHRLSLVFSLKQTCAPGQAGVATGGTLAFTFLGVVVGPPLFGLVAGLAGGYGLAYATLVIPGAICLAVMWACRAVFAR